MDAQDLVGRSVGQDLHKALGLVVDLGAAVGGEGELALLVVDARRLQRLFGLADPGHFRAGVDDRRHQVVVDVANFARDQFDHGHGVFLGLVGQHRAVRHVADDPDARRRGLEVVVGDETALIRRDADRLQPQTGGVGTPANGDQHHVALQGFSLAAPIFAFLGGLQRQFNAVLGGLGAGDLGAHAEGHALLGQAALEGGGDFAVHARADLVEEFHDRDLGAQATPDRAELKADDAGTGRRCCR